MRTMFRTNSNSVTVRALVAVCIAVLTVACAQRAQRAPETALSFEEAVDAATDDLLTQTQKLKLPAFVARLESKLVNRGLTVDPVVEASSGNQTAATTAIEARIVARAAAKFPGVEVLRFDATGLPRAQYLLAGSIERLAAEGGADSGTYRIDLALTDLKTAVVVAQASSRARSNGIDSTPTPYYRDSPVLVKDAAVEHTVATSRGTVGQPANREYVARASTSSLIAQAATAYNNDQLEEALALYGRALESPGGDQIRVHNGIYLINWRLGRLSEAEAAFSRVVAVGLANKNLGVKFLFKPNSTEFWSDTKISGPYDIWLRQIARQAANRKACLVVVGHTSRTGPEQYNDRLSHRRAEFIRQRLESEANELTQRVQAAGKGFRENLVGTGTDDLRDALDRRVEFKVDNCR